MPTSATAQQDASSLPLALRLPLRGSQLIEASAGTGKTFTIALLYVRLVLGHGQPDDTSHPQDNGFVEPLVPPDILVVTFTEAASQELKDRIRTRLVEAAEAFRQTDVDQDDLAQRDPLLAALRGHYPRDRWPHCARRLETAAEWMDDAAISTIHSWTQRMLKEHAFDSGKLFQQEVVKDLADMTQDAVFDYWRTRVYPLDQSQADAFMAAFSSPFELSKALRPLLQRHDAQLCLEGQPLPSVDLVALLEAMTTQQEERQRIEAQARDAYLLHADAIQKALMALRGSMNGNTFKGKNDETTFNDWLDELDRWGRGELNLSAAPFVAKLATRRFRLNKGAVIPDFALHDLLDQWHDAGSTVETHTKTLKPQVLADARHWVTQRLAEQLAQRAQMGFDDMIQGLDRALNSDGGENLAKRLRQQFPVAMIDEFQDTDPAQYRIFDAIYRLEENDPDTALVLIGDPKQAIYGFRGGDIYTYLRARQATWPRVHTLDTNFRSSQAAVDAVNRLFGQAEHKFARGAFRFTDARHPKDDERYNPLPFDEVKANGQAKTLMLGNTQAPALTAWWVGEDDQAISKGRYLAEAARHCANQIATWLNQAQEGNAGFTQSDQPFKPLGASDIAILVRDRTEAAAIREALRVRQLASVYLSDRDSVFATREASDLWRWLQAMADPGAVDKLRTALATPTLGLSLQELDTLQGDESRWERTQERFVSYRARWQQRGILPALRQLFHDYKVPEHLLVQEQGERRLTNLLHLAEWAQGASDTLDGDHALIRLLGEHIAHPGTDEQILRLESDAELIQVVTIFKSKGLEYPIVILPFIGTFKEINGKWGTPLFHDDQGQALLELASKSGDAKDSFKAANDERLSEEMRLLYVALTRAKHATFMGLSALKQGNGSTAQLDKAGIGYLLAGGASLPDLAAIKTAFKPHVEACSFIHDAPADSDDAVYQAPASSQATKTALAPQHRTFPAWWIASYSSLQQKGLTAPQTAQEEVAEEEHQPVRFTPMTGTPAEDTLHAFPRGPGPGTFLHGVLESLANEGFQRSVEDPQLIATMQKRCAVRGWDAHADTLASAIQDWLKTPLAPESEDGPVLSSLTHYRAEPDFWFSTSYAKTPVLDRWVEQHLFPDMQRPKLGFQWLNGLMKGFIDLLAEHNGQYYVIDWKSNWLGPDDAAYSSDALKRAALDKRYDMQLAVYLLALHRHLRLTLPDYDYERDVGGAMLVFLRGIQAPGRGVLKAKPSRAFIERLDDIMAGQSDGSSDTDHRHPDREVVQ